jgi:uncharacterized protein YdeI (YjbR/CyaY-like superfamily)
MSADLNDTNLLYVKNREEWRQWLERHYKQDNQVWLVFYKKHTGITGVTYNDAVEEALCFGWIDSIVRRIDQDKYTQRFSVRRAKSHYSQANKERLKMLVEQGKVIDEVRSTLGDILEEQFEIPEDILAAIQANPQARENFRAFSQPYIRIRTAFIDAARNRPAEFQKRLKFFIKMTEKNKLFGFGGIEKYYGE